jgi:hypothetical protein
MVAGYVTVRVLQAVTGAARSCGTLAPLTILQHDIRTEKAFAVFATSAFHFVALRSNFL